MKKPNIFEGRTKEWDSTDWQGRSKKQVESGYRVMGLFFKLCAVIFMGWAIYTVLTNVLG